MYIIVGISELLLIERLGVSCRLYKTDILLSVVGLRCNRDVYMYIFFQRRPFCVYIL